MVERIIRGSLRNRVAVIAAAVLLLIIGGYQALRMPVDVFPDLTAPTVTIVAESHGMAPEEVERLITFPIETAMNGASGVRRVRSSTGVGIAVVSVEFDWGSDIYRARQIVSEKLQNARNSLPGDIPPPELAPVTSIMGEVMFIGLHSETLPATTVRTVADWQVRRRLLAVPGVAEVIPIGGEKKQYQIQVDPERLAATALTINQVIEAARESNENASAGFLTETSQEYLIHGFGRVTDVADLEQSVVTVRDGVPLTIGDVAKVMVGTAPRRGTGGHNATPAVILGIQKQPNANTLELTRRLDAVFSELEASIPEGVSIQRDLFRQADFIEQAIDNLSAALRDGALLVVVIVFAFLVSVRATLITLLAIPLSVVAAIVALNWIGATLNTMTLGGLAIAIGALVDDAIIVVENVVKRLRRNQMLPASERRPVLEVVVAATREIQASIVYATFIIVLVFLPLFFLSGVEGRLLQPLGFAYIVALVASLAVALTVTPVLCYFLLPREGGVQAGREPVLVVRLKAWYRPLLDWSLEHTRTVMIAAAVALAVSMTALALAGRSFLPEFNEGSLTISVVTLPGTPLAFSDELGRMVEEILLEQPEVLSTGRRTGRAELDPHAQEVYASEIDVRLSAEGRGKDELLVALRARLNQIPGANIIFGQPISHRIDHMLSGTRANIAIKIFGDDLYRLRQVGKQVETLVQGVPGAVDVVMEEQSDIPFAGVRFDRRALAGYGLTVHEAGEAIEAAFQGVAVSRVFEGDSSFELTVRYPERFSADLDAVRNTLLTSRSGALLPLAAIADIRKERGPNRISRENVQRKLVVMANVAERDLVSVVDDIRSLLAASLELPAGMHIEYGGQFESAAEAGRVLLIALAGVVIGIFLLLYVEFGSMRDALLVMLNLPLAIIGGVAGVYLIGGVVSIAAMIGFITLFGIATRNGVILIDHIRHRLADGSATTRQGIREAALDRLIPILMTALAAGLALVPLALAMGESGSEIQAPMAVVILWGLLSSTALNMIVVPAVYLRHGARSV